MLDKMKGMSSEDTEDTKEPVEETKKMDTSKLEKMKSGGAERTVEGYTKQEQKEGEGMEMLCDCAPELRLKNEENPEIEEFEIGDSVTVKMVVTGMDYRTEKDGVKCRVTLSLTEK